LRNAVYLWAHVIRATLNTLTLGARLTFMALNEAGCLAD
jgi:hypothetical protein